MGIEALRDALEADGRERAARIREEAEAEAARIRAQAEAEAARRRAERLAREEARLRRETAVRMADARREALRRVLEARTALLDELFRRAEAALPSDFSEEPWRSALLEAAGQALAHVPAGDVTLIGSPGAGPVLEEAFAGRPDVRVEVDPAQPAGFRVSGAGGEVVVDGTLATRLALDRPRLASLLLERLQRAAESEAPA